MPYPRILTIQDLSCLGQCSLTVALPVLSACGAEACPLPSAVLSAHTGFTNPTFCDLSAQMPAILHHWQREGITFDALYSGYLGSAKQADMVCQAAERCLQPQGKWIVDPAMADHGALYAGLGDDCVDAMRMLCRRADVILPNLTEACLLTGMPWTEHPTPSQARDLMEKLLALGCANVVLTGFPGEDGRMGVGVASAAGMEVYLHERLPRSSPGTGDVFASVLTGAWVRGWSLMGAARLAADFVVRCIRLTQQEPNHWYGVRFEPLLGALATAVERVLDTPQSPSPMTNPPHRKGE